MKLNDNLDMDNAINIEISKKKIFIALLGCIAFVLIGLWIILGFDSEQRPILILILGGYGSVIFFGAGIFVMIRQILSDTGGITINDSGLIFDNRHPKDCFVSWEDIDNISTFYVYRTKIVSIHLKDPSIMINKQENKWIKRAIKFNHDQFGATISLTANNLKIKHNSLIELLNEKLEKNKSTNAQHSI